MSELAREPVAEPAALASPSCAADDAATAAWQRCDLLRRISRLCVERFSRVRSITRTQAASRPTASHPSKSSSCGSDIFHSFFRFTLPSRRLAARSRVPEVLPFGDSTLSLDQSQVPQLGAEVPRPVFWWRQPEVFAAVPSGLPRQAVGAAPERETAAGAAGEPER